MSTEFKENHNYVVFEANAHVFAIETTFTSEMFALNAVSWMPKKQTYVRGIFNLRGEVLPVVDFRIFMNFPSAKNQGQELVAELKKREQDHRNWISELENSIKEKRQFKLTTDPHACAFGKWYDQFQTNHMILNLLLKKFDEPHQDIHHLAITAKTMIESNDSEGALALIETKRESTLSYLHRLFEEAYATILDSQREIGLVVQFGEQKLILAVDSVLSVEFLKEGSIELLSSIISGVRTDCTPYVGRRTRDNDIVMIVDVASLYREMDSILGEEKYKLAPSIIGKD
jgi:purine-binding chemotaxis protein CheW